MKSHNPSLLLRHTRPAQAGFTLVELMVGLAIGMLATLVVMQVFSVFEVQKRATTGTADAQTNGNIALYNVTRELQMAGYALPTTGLPAVPDSALECAMPIVDVSTAGAAASAVSLSPVSILDGGNGSDSITVRYGSTHKGGVTTKITAAVIGNNVPVGSNLGCATMGNDLALVMNGTNCALTRLISGVQPANTLTFIDNRAMTAGAAVLTAKVACLGGTWNQITFSVGADNLVRGAEPIVAGIVNIQAQYGISAAANNNQVTAWVDASAAPWDNPGVAARNRIKAVHIAIVARSGAREEAFVTNNCTTAKGTVNNGPCAWDDANLDAAPAINLGAAGGEWQHYRYKVFETIIPIRNVIWARGTL